MKKDLLIAAVALAVVVGICFGIGQIRAELPPPQSTPFSTATGPTLDKSETIVMRVNGEAVTERELNAFVESSPQQSQMYYTQAPDGRRRAANDLAKLKALEQEGRRLGVEKDSDARAWVSLAQANVLARHALQKIVQKPSEQRVRAEYDKVKSAPAAMEWSHIMIAYQGGGAPARRGNAPTLDQARQKAQTIIDNIRAGARFEDVARAESDDGNSAANGGRLPGVNASMLPPEVQSLKAGEISGPVMTPYGIHIFRLAVAPLDAVRPQIEAQLQSEDAQAAAERLQKAAKIELDPKYFPPAKAASQKKPS